jgi:AAA+ superfamily predicted ATPase
MIVLLSGSPGVGKTLTAESRKFSQQRRFMAVSSSFRTQVAETIEAPLYNVSASDLGTNASGAERQLRDAFLRCKCWNALLLIDEADVFLTTRDINSLERNELVSGL